MEETLTNYAEEFPKNSTYKELKSEYLKHFKSITMKINAAIRKQNLEIIKETQKLTPKYKIGDVVYCKNIKKGFGEPLFQGPWKIVQIYGHNAYKLKNANGKEIVRNEDKLKKTKITEEIKPMKMKNEEKNVTTERMERMARKSKKPVRYGYDEC